MLNSVLPFSNLEPVKDGKLDKYFQTASRWKDKVSRTSKFREQICGIWSDIFLSYYLLGSAAQSVTRLQAACFSVYIKVVNLVTESLPGMIHNSGHPRLPELN